MLSKTQFGGTWKTWRLNMTSRGAVAPNKKQRNWMISQWLACSLTHNSVTVLKKVSSRNLRGCQRSQPFSNRQGCKRACLSCEISCSFRSSLWIRIITYLCHEKSFRTFEYRSNNWYVTKNIYQAWKTISKRKFYETCILYSSTIKLNRSKYQWRFAWFRYSLTMIIVEIIRSRYFKEIPTSQSQNPSKRVTINCNYTTTLVPM